MTNGNRFYEKGGGLTYKKAEPVTEEERKRADELWKELAEE